MNQVSMSFLAEMWRETKAVEVIAQTRRREIEDEIVRMLGKQADFQGKDKVYDIDIVWCMSESLDREALLATGLDNETLSTFVRWKPELNKAAYKTAPESVRLKIDSAITRKPSRPSFSDATKKEGK